MSGRQKGMVQIWDVVGFDEVADLQKMPKEVITTMKTYCESGTYQRGHGGGLGRCQHRHVRQHQPAGRRDGAVRPPLRADAGRHPRRHGLHRPAALLPARAGRCRRCERLFTDHYGFVVDYLAEALRELRKHNFTEIIDQHFSLGSHLNARDRKAVRKTVSGLMKIIHPHGEPTQDELAEILEFAIEGRRRVKEQLKKMGSFEYYQTSFSYIDRRNRRGALRRRAGTRRARPDRARSAGARLGLHRGRDYGRHGRPVPHRGLGLGGHRQAEDRRRRERHDQGVDPAGLRLHAGPHGRTRHRA